MRKKIQHRKLMDRRSFMLGGLQIGLASVLSARLYQLQTLKSAEYATLAEDNRINIKLIMPERGLILDRFGAPLARNLTNYQLTLDRKAYKERAQLFEKIRALLQLDDAQALEDMTNRQLRRNPRETSLIIKEYLTWEEVSIIEFNAPDLPGISVEDGMLRDYPLSYAASHLLGYVGTPSPEEAKGNRLLKMPGMKIGKNGLERKMDTTLRGEAGLRYMEVNARGQYLQEVKRKPSDDGATVRSTIIKELQEFSAARLGEESGSVVVIDTSNGDVLALTSVPSYDPNRFSRGISHSYWDELMKDKKTPLVNKCITGQYPPGSTYKMIVGLQALEKEIVKPDETVYCPGYFYVGRHRFNCWKHGGHGHMSYTGAIEQSCDVYFYTVARQLGIEPINSISHEFGLGEHYNLGLVGENSGLIPSPEWKQLVHQQPWQTGDTINASIGQGYVLTTPLQLAIMTARLATGTKVVPRLIMPDGEEKPVAFPELSINKRALELAQRGMIDVVNGSRGTARGSVIRESGFEMAGKTGTSQVRKITVRGQDQSTLPWEQRHHGLFVGYAPYHLPRYACAVVIEHGGGGASAAAPVARDVLLKVQEIMRDKETT